MNRFAAARLVSIHLALIPAGAIAQSPGADENSTEASIAQNLTTAPAAGKWQVTGSLGFQLETGRTSSFGVSLNSIVAHATKRLQLVRVDAELNRSEYKADKNSKRVVSDDNVTGMLTILPRTKRRVAPLLVLSSRHDGPAGLTHRTMWQLGPYVQLITSPKLAFAASVVGGSALQDNANTASTEHVPTYGAMQSLTWKPVSTTTVTIYGAQHRNAHDSRDYGVLVNTSGSATLTRILSLYMYHKYVLETIHPAGVSSAQQSIGTGIQVSIM